MESEARGVGALRRFIGREAMGNIVVLGIGTLIVLAAIVGIAYWLMRGRVRPEI